MYIFHVIYQIYFDILSIMIKLNREGEDETA